MRFVTVAAAAALVAISLAPAPAEAQMVCNNCVVFNGGAAMPVAAPPYSMAEHRAREQARLRQVRPPPRNAWDRPDWTGPGGYPVAVWRRGAY